MSTTASTASERRCIYQGAEDLALTYEFSDMLEIHVTELCKTLSGTGRMDEWIRLLKHSISPKLKHTAIRPRQKKTH